MKENIKKHEENVAVDKHYIKVLYSFGTVEGDANGFLMYIGEPAEFPTLQVMDKNVLLFVSFYILEIFFMKFEPFFAKPLEMFTFQAI